MYLFTTLRIKPNLSKEIALTISEALRQKKTLQFQLVRVMSFFMTINYHD